MGKASTWLRSLLSSSKKSSSSSPATKNNRKSSSSSNSKWTQFKSSETDHSSTSNAGSMDANKHAIAVAVATAAVAEAAISAAQAAAEVVRLTNAGTNRSIPSSCGCGGGGGGGCNSRERRRELAAIKIQSAFRAYLARRALRALKGFVKLQAIVRGRIVRKQSADMLRRMQALVRIQARACASRAHISRSSQPFLKSSQFHLAGNTKFSKYQQHPLGTNHCGPTLKKGGSKSRFDVNVRNIGLESSWLDRSMEESSWNHANAPPHENLGFEDEKNEKILEIDTWKPRTSLQNTQYFMTRKYQKPHPSVSSGEVSSLKSPNSSQLEDQVLLWNSNNSPYGQSASSRRNPFTPTRSECNRSFFGEYVGYPNYMTYTESSVAKVRSQSVPRQRMLSEKVVGGGDGQRMLPEKIVGGDGGRGRVYGGNWDVETSSEKGFSSVHANLTSKARSSSVHKYRNKT